MSLPSNAFQWRRNINLFGKLIFSFVLLGRARNRKSLKKESKFHCQKTRAGEEIPLGVLQKMRITISNLDICKKTNLKSYGKKSFS